MVKLAMFKLAIFKLKTTQLALLLVIIALTGCQSFYRQGDTQLNETEQEYILSKVNNYRGLIKLYRQKLQRQENAAVRYKLAYYYYQSGDYEASRLFLRPLLTDNGTAQAWLLESKNLLGQGNTEEALVRINRALQLEGNSGEAQNLRGVLLAEKGDYIAAHQSFSMARQQFIDDNIVVNNLAMVEILRQNYSGALDYLMPLYMRGQADKRVAHNLVYTLIQLQQYQQAEAIMQQEKLNADPQFMYSLAAVKPRSLQQQLTQTIRSQQNPNHATGIKPAATPITPLSNRNRAALARSSRPATPRNNQKPPLSGQSIALPARPTIALSTVQSPMQPAPLPSSVRKASAIATPPAKGSNRSVWRANSGASGTLKEVSAVRMGEYNHYFRMTLESKYAINFNEIASNDQNKRVFELHNVRLGSPLLDAGQKISPDNQKISNLNFYQQDANTVRVEVGVRDPASRTTIYRMAGNRHHQERLVFDIYRS